MEVAPEFGPGPSPLERGAIEGDSPVSGLESVSYGRLSESRIAWECSLNGW